MTMCLTWRCLLLSLIALATIQVRCQTDSLGFISIDCGIPANTGYVDNKTQISYVSDSGFTDTGVNRDVSVAYLSSRDLARGYLTLRSFPDGDRNCYTLGSLTSGIKYLLRATFLYGDYDGLSKPPVFDVYLGVNLWGTVDLGVKEEFAFLEILAFSPSDYLQVCLVNKKLGTPIISTLVLRPLKPSLYPDIVNVTQSLVLFDVRWNMGVTDWRAIVRYPDDPHDRVWFPYDGSPDYIPVSTSSPVSNLVNDVFEPPSAVMQTAMTPVNSNRIDYSWKPSQGGINNFFIVLFLSELTPLPPNAVREFNVLLGGQLFLKEPFSPQVLVANVVYGTARGLQEYNLTLNATQRSTLPPILNALEIYTIMSATQMATDKADVAAITVIKARYQVKRNWVGDPCVPKAFAWDGLDCSYAAASPARVTTLKLSKRGLSGVIIASFADLEALQYLDLSQNDLSGPIPDFLENLSSLVYLDLSGNKLDKTIPAGLLKRSQEGSLTLRIGNSCTTCEPRNRSKIAIIASVVAAVIVAVVATTVTAFMCKKGTRKKATAVQSEGNDSNYADLSLQLDNKKFSTADLKKITNGFHNEIGRGAFGIVFAGQLENGIPVAVKMLNKSSLQGIEEFMAEIQFHARTLMKVHHKNLVSMIGYCKDRKCLALVYEFMSCGALQGRLRGKESNDKPLTWLQRLRIALESAQGLEYLHTLCQPRLIHRDVKTANILLSGNLEAKIADFGLSKAFESGKTHVSTRVAGTPGYLDPEYYTSYMLTDKSDVFSFGVVLLELVTGKPPILEGSENGHIIQWVKERIGRGNIESIADPNMKGQYQYDVNSLWKVTDLALNCTAQSSNERPTMPNVVILLKESLELAISSCSEAVHESNDGVSSHLPTVGSFQGETSYASSNSNIIDTPVAADHGPGAR